MIKTRSDLKEYIRADESRYRFRTPVSTQIRAKI